MFLKKIIAVLLKTSELTPEQQELFDKHVEDVKRIPYTSQFRSKYYSIPPDDGVSLAFEALLRSVQSFDPTRGTKFSTFLWTSIDNAYQNELRERVRDDSPLVPLEQPSKGGPSSGSAYDESNIGKDEITVIDKMKQIQDQGGVDFENMMSYLKQHLDSFWYDFIKIVVNSVGPAHGTFMGAVEEMNERYKLDWIPQRYNNGLVKKIRPVLEQYLGVIESEKQKAKKPTRAPAETEVVEEAPAKTEVTPTPETVEEEKAPTPQMPEWLTKPKEGVPPPAEMTSQTFLALGLIK